MDSEKKIEQKLRKLIESKGGLCIKFQASFFNGFPDRICLLPGAVIFFVEVKTTGKKATKLQLKVHEALTKLGFVVLVIDKLSQLEDLDKIC